MALMLDLTQKDLFSCALLQFCSIQLRVCEVPVVYAINFCQKVSKRKKEEEEVLVSGRVSIYLPLSLFFKGRHFDAILLDHERLLLFR